MVNITASVPLAVSVSLCVAALIIVGGFIVPLFFVSRKCKEVYFDTLVRSDGEKWGYRCSAPSNQEQMEMWEEGSGWARDNAFRMREVDITSFDGLHLHGEFYDFGSDSCVIILPGRCECLRYSCYFAKPYGEMGISVLVIDSRCHGQSGGKYTTIGRDEGRDACSWAEFANRALGMKNVWFHGICVGCAGAFVCAAEGDCPECVRGIIAEGPYVTFRETFKQHLIYDKHPVFPVTDLVMYRIKKHAGVDYKEVAPIRLVKKLELPVLYIFGEKDAFSRPEKSRELFAATKSEAKEIQWFSKGSHSHLRINNKEAYDNAVKAFVKKHMPKES